MLLRGAIHELHNQVQIECEYPGQTMLIALAIMLQFSSLKVAAGKGSYTSNAMESSAIPGAGDAVAKTLNKLKEGVEKDYDAATMINALHNTWREYAGHQPSYADRVEPGLKRAAKFEDSFSERWAGWKVSSQAVA